MTPAGQVQLKHIPTRLYVIGDVHVGAAACHERRFREYVARIRSDKRGVWLGLGDLIEAIGIDDRRWSPGAVDQRLTIASMDDIYQAQVDLLLDALRPIAGKCIGLLRGNHEQVAMDRTRTTGWWRSLVAALGARDLGYSAILDFVLPGGRRIRTMAHHGAGGAATAGGKAMRLRRFADTVDADLVLVGHMHVCDVQSADRIGADAQCRKLVERRTTAVCCGSWLRGYDAGSTTYAERAGYLPTRIGAPIITLSAAHGASVAWA